MSVDDQKPVRTGIDPSANATYQAIINRDLERFGSAVATINELTAARIRDVREPYFQAVILPILRKRVRNEVCENLGVWLNVADGLNNPINVVDDDGKLLFVCPPAFTDIHLSTKTPEGRFTTTHHVVQQQADMIANGDMRGIMAIEEGIFQAHRPTTRVEDYADAVMKLVDIYKFYSLPMEELLGEQAGEILALAEKRKKSSATSQVAATQEESHDASSDDDLIY